MTTPKSNVVKYKNNESSAIIPKKIIKNMKTKVIIIYSHNILFLIINTSRLHQFAHNIGGCCQ